MAEQSVSTPNDPPRATNDGQEAVNFEGGSSGGGGGGGGIALKFDFSASTNEPWAVY